MNEVLEVPHQRLEDYRDDIRKCRKVIPQIPTSYLFSVSIQCVDASRYMGVTLDKSLTSSTRIDQVRNKSAQSFGEPLILNRKRGLSIRNGYLLYNWLVSPIMDCTCPIRKFAACTHVGRLLVLHSKCFRLADGALWYHGRRQIHKNSGVPFFAVHTRVQIASFDSKLAVVGYHLVWKLGR